MLSVSTPTNLYNLFLISSDLYNKGEFSTTKKIKHIK